MMNIEVKNKIIANVDSLREELVRLISNLVQIPSINPTYPGIIKEDVLGGETKVNKLLKSIMESIGLKTDLWEEEKGRANLVGIYKGTSEGKSIIFNGHVDVVPPGPENLWTKAGPWSGKIVNGKIYGRGTSDMKAGNAAAIIALKAVLNAGYQPKGDVIIEDVVGEEMMNTEVGTGATIKRGYKADAAIVMESSAPPYPLALLTASPGVVVMRVTIKGKPAHTSMRDELVRAGGKGFKIAVSAIDKGFIIYQGILKLEEEWGQNKSHPVFTHPGHFTICPTSFIGGLHGIAYIPEECFIDYVIWHAPQDSLEQVKKEIEEQISRFAQIDPWLRENPPQVEWNFWWPPYEISPNAPICKAVTNAYEAVMNKPVKIYGFAAVNDATFLNKAGIPTITLGPGSIQVAHSVNEYVEIREVIDAAKIYALTIAEWCGI